jgi:hypothetical protein
MVITMELECQNCKKEISFEVARASMNYLRKQLCIKCQVDEVKKTYAKQPVLMEQKLKELSKYL